MWVYYANKDISQSLAITRKTDMPTETIGFDLNRRLPWKHTTKKKHLAVRSVQLCVLYPSHPNMSLPYTMWYVFDVLMAWCLYLFYGTHNCGQAVGASMTCQHPESSALSGAWEIRWVLCAPLLLVFWPCKVHCWSCSCPGSVGRCKLLVWLTLGPPAMMLSFQAPVGIPAFLFEIAGSTVVWSSAVHNVGLRDVLVGVRDRCGGICSVFHWDLLSSYAFVSWNGMC